jgi:ABC-type lipoprotein release transport system permease subunit
MIFFVGTQTLMQTSQISQYKIPNVELNGRDLEDDKFRFKSYADIGDLSSKLKEECPQGTKVYSVTSRSLESVQDLFNSVWYRIYGVNSQFLKDQIDDSSIKEGKLPSEDKQEAVIGSLVAKKYNLKIGDKLDIPVTLKNSPSDEDKGNYTVSAILNDDVEYFNSVIFINKDLYEKKYGKVGENIVLIYYSGANMEKQVFDAYSKIKGNFNVGSFKSNSSDGANKLQSILLNLAIVYIISIIVILLIISYSMKGVSKKIGLLKALGFSDSYIIKNFIGGLLILSSISIVIGTVGVICMKHSLNSQISKFYGYAIDRYKFNLNTGFSILGLWIVLSLGTYLVIKIKSFRVSPRQAMLK